MADIRRANPHLSEIIVILDIHLANCKGDPDEARQKLSKSENEWIDAEVLHCMLDARYFISNYYAYRDEKEGFRGLYPLFDSQEILYEKYRELERLYGKVRALVLKARQMGSTTYNIAEFFHKTMFAEHVNAIIVGQDESAKDYFMGMYESALDFIPWWMRPRIKQKQTGQLINFDEKDEQLRLTRPGLKTWVYADNAKKPSGVGRSKTFGRAMLSELAFWENGSQLSKALFPTFNTPDGFYIMESTANGRNDFWHNLWRRAEAGTVDWHPIFIPFYRRAVTYSLPILKTEVFVLTDDEKQIKERVFKKESFIIKDETFKWVRNRKEEFVAIDGDDSMFSQEYTSEPEESFQASAITAFPRGLIRRLSRMTRNPKWIGEITYNFQTDKPVLHVRETTDSQEITRSDTEDCLHIWEKPIQGEEYTVGCDVALGNPGGDYSTCSVLKKGRLGQKDMLVAVWRGLINPEALAEKVLALGWLYNEAMAAIEVNSFGRSTNNTLMRAYEYDNIYRYKRLDRITNFITNIVGFLTTFSTKDDLLAKMSEFMLDDRIDIPCRWTMDEFNDFTEEGAKGDGAHDDLVMSLMIALYCGREAEARDRREGLRKKEIQTEANVFQVKDRFGSIMLTTNSQVEAQQFASKVKFCSIERTMGATAKINLLGRVRKVPADFQNTESAPLHDNINSTAHRLVYEDGEAPEDVTREKISEAEAAQEEEEQEAAADAGDWRFN